MHAIILVVVLFLTNGDVKADTLVGGPGSTMEGCLAQSRVVREHYQSDKSVLKVAISCGNVVPQ